MKKLELQKQINVLRSDYYHHEKQIIGLYNLLHELKEEREKLQYQLEELKFKIEFPPKYKVGDKIEDNIITGLAVFDSNIFSDLQPIKNTILVTSTIPVYKWQYKVTNIKTGETSTILE